MVVMTGGVVLLASSGLQQTVSAPPHSYVCIPYLFIHITDVMILEMEPLGSN